MSYPSRIGVREMLSYQSLTPAVAGISRYENWGAGWWKCLGVIGHPCHPLDSGFRRNDDWGAGLTSAGAVAFRHSGGCVASFSYQ